MNCGVYDSKVKNTILFYMQVPENVENINTKLKLVDINLTFIPIYGIDIKRIITGDKNVLIFREVKATINELYEGMNIYIVIEIVDNNLYDDYVDLDNINLGINISYYDVELDKRTDILLNSSYTPASNDEFEEIIRNIKSWNRPRIKPHTNAMISSDSDDLYDIDILYTT
jgi:hypothetical protein